LNKNINQSNPLYTKNEELANIISHGMGLLMSVPGLIALILVSRQAEDPWQLVGFIIFGLSLTLLYFFSTAYHSITDYSLKQKFRILDHSAIFVLIAGTYTPFLVVHLRGPLGWTMMGVIWGLAIAGIIIKLVFGVRYKKLSLALYILMGWLCVFAFREMYANLPSHSFYLLVIGGLLYTGGVVFYNWKKLPYHHAIWHLFVLGGSAFHYFAILYSV
jgi:hemolysin III